MSSLHDRLMEGCIRHPKRWSGDTHDDLGGSIREGATDDLMKEAAEELKRLELLIAEPPTKVIQRYINARDAYEAATGCHRIAFGYPKTLRADDPIKREWLQARIDLLNLL